MANSDVETGSLATHDGVDELPVMIFLVEEVDGGGWQLVDCNKWVEQELGYSRDMLVGKPLSFIMCDRASGVQEFRKADGGSLRAITRTSDALPHGRPGLARLVAMPLPITIDPEHSVKLGLLGDLAHHVVHELNQPLSVIRMALGTARRKLRVPGDIDVALLEAKLDRIDAQCMRAAAIAETLRVFVPRDRGHEVSLDIERAIQNALSMCAPVFRKLNVSMDAKVDAAFQVRGNEMHLEPALLCILGEIHDRMEEVVRHADTAALKVTIATRSVDDGYVEIVIRDNAGVAAEGIDQARAVSALSLGMGIATAAEIARELHGRLEQEATTEGMIYRVVLPSASPDFAAR
jgi:signal transduction histidine kinase